MWVWWEYATFFKNISKYQPKLLNCNVFHNTIVLSSDTIIGSLYSMRTYLQRINKYVYAIYHLFCPKKKKCKLKLLMCVLFQHAAHLIELPPFSKLGFTVDAFSIMSSTCCCIFWFMTYDLFDHLLQVFMPAKTLGDTELPVEKTAKTKQSNLLESFNSCYLFIFALHIISVIRTMHHICHTDSLWSNNI